MDEKAVADDWRKQAEELASAMRERDNAPKPDIEYDILKRRYDRIIISLEELTR